MKYKIVCRAYTDSGEECLQLNEYGFVGIWTKRNRNQCPDISVNVKDVLTIEPIE